MRSVTCSSVDGRGKVALIDGRFEPEGGGLGACGASVAWGASEGRVFREDSRAGGGLRATVGVGRIAQREHILAEQQRGVGEPVWIV